MNSSLLRKNKASIVKKLIEAYAYEIYAYWASN